ncbi:hypothetical protein PABG_12558 [Paracoccidioides brasiliensis Pb03]|nr:hypothetical protein PABG_12558 [Paracoccidioides brasiliensis Pb03]
MSVVVKPSWAEESFGYSCTEGTNRTHVRQKIKQGGTKRQIESSKSYPEPYSSSGSLEYVTRDIERCGLERPVVCLLSVPSHMSSMSNPPVEGRVVKGASAWLQFGSVELGGSSICWDSRFEFCKGRELDREV